MPIDLSADLTVAALVSQLGDRAADFAVEVVDECASTNAALMEAPLARDGAPGAVLVARCQTAGKGRRGHRWMAWPDSSLTFSLRWHFRRHGPAPAGLSLVVGVAVASALEKVGVTGLFLKWPNDVLVQGAKLAGILVELRPERQAGTVAVIGIGLNLAIPPGASIPGQPAVTGLADLMAVVPPPGLLLGEILRTLADMLDLYDQAGFAAFRGAWLQRHAHQGATVTISGDGIQQVGICEGVDEDGALLLRDPRGLHRVLSGDVSLRRAPP
ncbi:MAG: biotin--[acetyl-CoA-carboxylase] ligase [Zoogloeaceae bacterium]|nr:biotin--[acetyl-CoA-carboxylase] ligase [Zoogloeaceae bacterium]